MKISQMEYENMVREGMHAARAGKRKWAARLLHRAASQNPHDARVWLWLSATTTDPAEQQAFLEKAIAADPFNPAAKKGLQMLAELKKRQKSGGTVEQEEPSPPPVTDPNEPVPATTKTYACPKCGGRMHYRIDTRDLLCEYCGYIHKTVEELAADAAEAAIYTELHSGRAGKWAASIHDVVCEKCGSHAVLPRAMKTRQCAYCGSNQLIESQQLQELVDPQVIALFRVEEAEALEIARNWLHRGMFAPDDLSRGARDLALRPAYYPFWTFDGGVEVRWSAQVREGFSTGMTQSPEWRLESGVVHEFFDDVLVSGVSALKPPEVAAIEPFNLKDVIRFDPEHIAGWTTMVYDRSLADASLIARARVIKQLRPRVQSQIAPGREKRDVQIGAGSWSGVTYKHILLPIWIGSYHYRGKTYHVLVNGQTGKVGGEKPRDRVKVFGIWLLGLTAIAALVILLVWLSQYLAGAF